MLYIKMLTEKQMYSATVTYVADLNLFSRCMFQLVWPFLPVERDIY